MNKATYGLIGYPLGHSLSPLMHNAAFKALNVPAEYKLFPLKEDALDGFFEGLKSEDCPIFGLNVTVPYKEKAIKYMDSMSPLAEKIRAVNTVTISNKRKLTGHNTDAPGFLAHLEELNISTRDKRIAIVGAGGAARAIVGVLCLTDQRPASIKIYDVATLKAAELVNDLGARIDVSVVESVNAIDDLDVDRADILINATPIGLKPKDPLPVDENMLYKNLMVYDLIYNPAQTPLLKAAKAKGAKTSNGLGMLYYQGVLAFQHWAELQLSEKLKVIMREALEEGLGL
jgi:shikimate dehydrogenase